MRDLVAVEADLPFAPNFFDGDVGQNVVVGVWSEDLSRARVEGGDEVGGALDLFGGDGEAAGDFGEPAFAEVGEEALDDTPLEGALFAEAAELDEQAVAQVASADADGMELLNDFEDALDVFEVDAAEGGDLLGAGLEEAAVVDIADEEFGDFGFVIGEFVGGDLLEEVLLEGFLFYEGVEEELAAFLLLGGASGVAAILGHVIAPFLVEFGEALEFLLELLVFALAVLDGGLGGFLLQGGVGLDFLLDQVAQLENRSLEDLETLLELRSENLLLREALSLRKTCHAGEFKQAPRTRKQAAGQAWLQAVLKRVLQMPGGRRARRAAALRIV
ncbi:MAG: hypothetical protein RLZZ142_1050 [Verrucomicrobiota bacterium]